MRNVQIIKFGIFTSLLVSILYLLLRSHMASKRIKSYQTEYVRYITPDMHNSKPRTVKAKHKIGIEYVRYITPDMHNSKPRNVKAKYKILFWLPFGSKNQMKFESACMKQCPVKCLLTSKKEDISQVDMVNFHLPDLWTEIWKINTTSIIKFPVYRRPDQIWMLSNREPPPKLYGNLQIFNGIFNWTLSYRKDATLHFPYGYATSLDENATVEESSRNYFTEKTREVTGVISNCRDTNRRYKFIKELSQYLNVTMFGNCYKNICGDRAIHGSCGNITKHYKFYLALENSRCKDYLTEKYWQALNRGQIPIVNWDLNTIDENIPIPGSYISVSDFKDVQTLANYIKRLSRNETLYNSYFTWERKYKIGNSCISCIACKGLHEGRPPQVINDLDGWVQDDICKKVDEWSNYLTRLDSHLFWKYGI